MLALIDTTISPLINLLRFRQNPIAFMRKVRATHDEIAAINLGYKQLYFAFEPRHAQHILLTNRHCYEKSRLIFDKIEPVTGKAGLVQLKGEQWKTMRRITSALFSPTQIAQYIPTIAKFTNELADRLEPAAAKGEVVDVSVLMTELILRTAGKLFLGVDFATESTDLGRAFLNLNRGCGNRIKSVIHAPQRLLTPNNLLIQRNQSKLNHYFDELLARQKTEGFATDSLPGFLLSRQAKGDLPEDSTLIRDQAMTFLFAGHETTASSLAFCLYLISADNLSQERIAAEAANLPRACGSDDLTKASYTLACYEESLRLYPPAWLLAREATADDEIDGRFIRRGTNIFLSVYEIHRHKRFWVDPDRFMPTRFLEKQVSHPFAYLPFGGGPRICSGMELARLEATLVLMILTSRFRFVPTEDKGPPEISAMITAHPKNGIPMRLVKR